MDQVDKRNITTSMGTSDKKFLFELLNTPSPTGFETPGQKVWANYTKSFVDRIENDAYGNTWAVIEGSVQDNASSLMLEAHADEIGFMVSYITDEGYIYVTRIGGSDRAIVRAKRVRILGDKGEVTGIFGNTAIHIRETSNERVPQWHDVFIDIGASKKDEVLERGIRVGHPIVFADDPVELSDTRLIGRALDNRIGGYIIAQVMQHLSGKKKKPECTVYAVNAVQEEIGGNGARMVSYRLHPSCAVVLDVTHATDSPGIDKTKHGDVRLGKGPTLTHGTSNHPLVVKRLMEVAEKEDIPLQHEASSRTTGTDTDKIFVSKTGIPSALVSLPMRYMHSTVEMVDTNDVDMVIKLLTGFAKAMKADDTFGSSITLMG